MVPFSTVVGCGGMRVLAFEDSFDIVAILTSAGVDMSVIDLKQHWESSNHSSRIAEYEPEILLLDHYMPPVTGLEVLQTLNIDVAAGAERPRLVIAMSSDSRMNARLIQFGADIAVRKFDIGTIDIWPR